MATQLRHRPLHSSPVTMHQSRYRSRQLALTALLVTRSAALAFPLRRRNLPLARRAAEGGRGLDHLSAALEEGDLVLYQTGSWTVDGVSVGDGDEPALAYAVVDTLQLVFTHNCEHGWIYGSALECDADGALRPPDGDTFVQFGPEQLLARLDGDALGDGYALCDGGKRAVEEARVRLGSWGD